MMQVFSRSGLAYIYAEIYLIESTPCNLNVNVYKTTYDDEYLYISKTSEDLLSEIHYLCSRRKKYEEFTRILL